MYIVRMLYVCIWYVRIWEIIRRKNFVVSLMTAKVLRMNCFKRYVQMSNRNNYEKIYLSMIMKVFISRFFHIRTYSR